MSFWSDASTPVKGTIVVGSILIVVAVLAFFQVGPFAGPVDGTTTDRGVSADQETAQGAQPDE